LPADLTAIKTVLLQWVDAQAGVGIKGHFRDDPEDWHIKPRVHLHLHGSKGVGVEFTEWDQDTTLDVNGQPVYPAGADFMPTVKGDRTITLSLFAESRDQTRPAWSILEKLRTSLRKASVKALLKTVGLSYSTTEAVVDLTSLVDDRVESSASLDVHFNAVVNDRDVVEADSYVSTVDDPVPTWH